MPYNASLDGIRGIAVILVMVFHSKAPFFPGGYLGVDVFYVLSGFLITSILHGELARTGTIDIPRFYLKRFARLAPPLFLMLALYLGLAPLAWPEYGQHGRDALLAAVYLSDYSRAIWGMPDMLRHTWSLAVEEHFYLLWPLVVLLLRPLGPRGALHVLLLLYVSGTVWRISCAAFQGWDMTYYRFDTRMTGMLIGAAAAMMLSVDLSPRIGRVAPALYLAFYLLFAVFAGWRDSAVLQYGVMLAELATAAAIIQVMQSQQPVRWLTSPLLVYVGQLSYGLYLFHFPVMLYLRAEYGWITAITLGTAAAFVIAAASYHTLEAMVRRWRSSLRQADAPRPTA